MADVSNIREHMEVRDAAGVVVGRVDHVEGDRIKLTRSSSGDGQHHFVPLAAVDHVDAHVHLNASAAALGLTGAAAGAGGESPLPPVQNRAVSGATPRGNFYLPWIVGIVGLLLLLLLFRSCVHHKEAAVVGGGDATVPTAAAPNGTLAQTAGAPQSAALSGLGAYLGGTEATPRTFQFEKLHFDTAQSVVRPVDQPEVNQVAAVLNQYGTAKIRVAGYADARGSDAANLKLGQDRADAVKAALVAQGIDGGRIVTVSGGANDPADTNATATGQAENRRTELVVVSR